MSESYRLIIFDENHIGNPLNHDTVLKKCIK